MFRSWSVDDRAEVLAWQRDRDDHCSSCGQRRSDWLDAAGVQLDPEEYPAEVTRVFCPPCAELARFPRPDDPEPGVHLGFRPLHHAHRRPRSAP